MNVPLADIEIPQYPSGSYNFIRRLRKEEELHFPLGPHSKVDTDQNHVTNASHKTESQPGLKLDIAIIGAGVGGLSAAIALKRCGHTVTVYEQAPALGEIGAGIQIPPNSTAILHSWGLKSALERRSVVPKAFVWRRWKDGSIIGKAKLNPEIEQRFGSPYYVTHRAHLHEVLHQGAVDLGVIVHLKKKVEDYGVEEGSVTFEDGSVVNADLVVAADGLKSLARRILNGESDKGPAGHGLSAYRGTIPTAEIKADPLVGWVMDEPNLNLWAGHDRHVMSYAIAEGQQYNMVLTHPVNAGDHTDKPVSQMLDEMKAYYEGWDPTLMRLLDMMTSTSEWPIHSIEIPQAWASNSGRFVLTGDAAHAMVPYMALGAAMAVEDAAALAASLKHVTSIENLPDAISMWVKARGPRVGGVHQASFANGLIIHLPDGPVQRARDEAMRAEVDGKPFAESANHWADPVTTEWAYRYDPVATIGELWAQEKQGKCELARS